MALTDDLIFSLEMDEASGDAIDAHSTLDFTETSGTIGSSGSYRDFEDGDTEYFSRASEAALQTGDIAFTLMCEINPESLSGFPVILHKGPDGAREHILYYSAGATQRLIWQVGNSVDVRWGSALSTATPYHVVIDHDPGLNQISIAVDNGTPVTASLSGGPTAGSAAFEIGAGSDQALYWDGLIRRVRFWKRILTSEERTQLYNSGSGLAYADFSGGGGDTRARLLGSDLFYTPLFNGALILQ